MSNPCAGPFGAVYDFYIERERLARLVGRVVWGIDVRPMYASMRAVGELPDGATVLDVPCGGGIALRGLRRDQDVRYLAVDLEEDMLARFRRRYAGAETIRADMRSLPLPDACADLCLTYSGLHCVPDPEAALAEVVRCLKPGGELIGSTFTTGGTRRQRRVFAAARRRGQAAPSWSRADIGRALLAAGLTDLALDGDGFAVFRARLRT